MRPATLTFDDIIALIQRIDSRESKLMTVLEDLKAAVARDAEMDAKLVEYMTVLRASIEDLSLKLSTAVAPTGVDEAAVKAVVDELNAHVDEMGKVLPAPVVEPAPEPAPVVDVAPVVDTPPPE